LQDRDADAVRVRELMAQFIGGCVKLLSGEPGLAAYLRRNLFAGTALDGTSLPLDAGDVDDIPWWIRQAVTTRDQRCRWPGGCDQPAEASQPHHVIHRFEHGTTSAGNLKLLCFLCRCRHNQQYADLRVIPRWTGFPGVLAGYEVGFVVVKSA
jgi:hypothetical protein